ncbi:hypothetical protein GQ602_003064 [Ophiocordyceps camponoti-floridani]|uniref:Uncharacterized protein n=1 Tax=Ophiocordyceps camponoti-floridani TaxID=2030778 RepID=A0A8H4Q7F2_9HYPO|nr:hypothetical protein GQ602_003064 [Ophiocordyceps camponoti-floridani]
MKFITNVLLFGAFATSVLATAIPEMGEAAEEGVSTVADAPGAVFAEAKRACARLPLRSSWSTLLVQMSNIPVHIFTFDPDLIIMGCCFSSPSGGSRCARPWGSRSASSDIDREVYRREYIRQVLREQDRETARRLSEHFGADIRALSRDEIVTRPPSVYG